ncbi:MAG TPA: hypothetical protein VM012_09315 [Flavitalea sp.]|nr:hypothetical protein [Flavitalea sp.]
MKKVGLFREAMIVFICFYLFFLGNLAANFSGPHDSIAYLNSIISGNPLFHQHHLLYHFFSHYWLKGMQALLPGVANFHLVEAFTALWGSGSLAIIYCFFRKRFNLTTAISIVGTTIIAFSYGMWFYSVNIEVYAMPLFFILWSLYILGKTDFTQQDLLKAAFLHCMAILFHQINILFAIVIFYKIWQQRHVIKAKTAIFQYVLMGAVLVGGMYFLVGWVYEGNNSMQSWTQWIRGYTTEEKYWQPLSITTPFHVAVGYSHAFVGGHYMFQLPLVENYINNSLPYHALHDEIYLSRNISASTAEILTAFTFVLVLLMVIMIIRFIKKFRTILAMYPQVLPPILICGAVYSLFFCFWMPEILEFWILQSVLLWLALIGTIMVVKLPYNLSILPAVTLMSVLLFVVNYFGSIRWMKHIENDLYYHKVKPLKGIAGPKDIIVVQDAWILKDFLEYYTHTEDIRPVPWTDSLRLATDSAIHATLDKKGRVFIYPQMNSMYRAPDTRYVDSLMKTYTSRSKVFHREDPLIWLIE